MNIQKSLLIITLFIMQSALSYQGYLTRENGDVILTIDNLCLLRNAPENLDNEKINYAFHEEGGEGVAYTMRYNLSGDMTIDQIEQIQNDLAAFARSLSNYDRTRQCDDVTYGLNGYNWHLSVNNRNLNIYSKDELEELIGADARLVPVTVAYGETPIDIITK